VKRNKTKPFKISAGKTGLDEDKYTTSRHQRAGEYPNIDIANTLSGKVAEFK
jgi:hypothetical protein